jgi:hypothetical protein
MQTAHLATIPSRENTLRLVLESIVPFVDHTFVSLNGYKYVPSWLDEFKAVTVSVNDNSLGDAMKFSRVKDVTGLVYILDDDLIYTPKFFSLLQEKVNFYKCPCSLHGKSYERPVVRFKSIKGNYRCLSTVDTDHSDIDIIGTGVLCYRTEMVKLSLEDFKIKNMSDIWYSKLAHEQGVKLVVAEHKAGIVRYLNPQETIWTSTKDYHAHDLIIKSFLK